MIGLSPERYVTLDAKLWHEPTAKKDWPHIEITDERTLSTRIAALVRTHDQRQPLYGKNFDAPLDAALRELFNLEEL